MENLTLYNKFRIVPSEAKKSIGGGRLKGMTDINPMWRIKTLTSEFGVCGIGWYYDIVKQELHTGAKGEIVASVTIDLFIKIEGEWSKPIPGLGGSMFVASEKNGLHTSDECFKMALTDAISVSCKALGIGADVYYQKDRTKYDQAPIQPNKKGIDAEVITNITNAVNQCTTLSDLNTIWTNNKELQTEKFFITLKDNRKKQLTK